MESTKTNVIFGLASDKYTTILVRRILAIFRQPLKKMEQRARLISRLATLEPQRTQKERYAVTQLIHHNQTITRAAILAWPSNIAEAPDTLDSNNALDKICSACQESLPTKHFRAKKITPGCDHECDYCNGCIATAVNIQLINVDTDWNALRCLDCASLLLPETIRRYASPQNLEAYDGFQACTHIANFSLKEGQNFCWCAHPDCRSGQIHELGEFDYLMTCIKCGKDTCSLHHVPLQEGPGKTSHDKAACSKKKNQETSDLLFIKTITKACPDCGVRIQKNGGCDMMYCKACDHQFLWSSVKA